jgi:hypothetical protein
VKSNIPKEAILIAETNFILDISFEQSKDCERLLNIIDKQGVKLTIPECAFAEAEGSIGNTIRNRIKAIDSALDALRQASRSAYHDIDDIIARLEKFKNDAKKMEIESLHLKMRFLEDSAIVITFTPESMARSEIRRLKNIAPFKASDRMIYESILEFAKLNQRSGNKKFFLTRDKEDFNFDFIREELASLNIEIFFSAGECIKRIVELTDTE